MIRTRFAPTPSGYLHWGNALSFVITWLMARQHAGTVRLRIDDLDQSRVRPDFIEDIFRSLEWLGLDYDRGPSGPDDFARNESQVHRIDLYRELLAELRRAARYLLVLAPGPVFSGRVRMESTQNRVARGSCPFINRASPGGSPRVKQNRWSGRTSTVVIMRWN